MLYMLLIASDPTQPPREGVIDEHFAFAREARQRGAYVTSEALMEPDTATTVRVREGRTLTIDGPFAETKEVLGGYYLLDCKDLDEAIELAAKLPAAKDGAVEIRPIRNIPGWEYTLVPERRN